MDVVGLALGKPAHGLEPLEHRRGRRSRGRQDDAIHQFRRLGGGRIEGDLAAGLKGDFRPGTGLAEGAERQTATAALALQTESQIVTVPQAIGQAGLVAVGVQVPVIVGDRCRGLAAGQQGRGRSGYWRAGRRGQGEGTDQHRGRKAHGRFPFQLAQSSVKRRNLARCVR